MFKTGCAGQADVLCCFISKALLKNKLDSWELVGFHVFWQQTSQQFRFLFKSLTWMLLLNWTLGHKTTLSTLWIQLLQCFYFFPADKEQTPREHSTETSLSFTFHCFHTHTLTGAPEMNYLSKIQCSTWALSIVKSPFLAVLPKIILSFRRRFWQS